MKTETRQQLYFWTFCLGLLVGLTPSLVYAKEIELGALDKVEQDLRVSQQHQTQLKAKQHRLGEELFDLRSVLIEATDETARLERDLFSLKDRLVVLDQKVLDQKAVLGAQQEKMASLLGALERLSMMPPEALLASPTTPIDKVRSSMLLQSAIPALKQRAERVSKELSYLVKLQKEVAEKQQETKEKQARLKVRQDEIQQLVAQRETLYAKVEQDRSDVDLQVAQLASRAQNLKDLMDQVEAQRRVSEAREKMLKKRALLAAEKEAHEKALAAQKQREARLKDMARLKGKWRFPVTGVIKTHFGDSDRYGSQRQGIIITPRSKAIVVAPSNGTVKFAGTFRGYGRIVIIEHKGGYHSLIAGLGTIETEVGHSVLVGEPVGSVSTFDKVKPEIYYELRRNGKPMNPEDKITVKNG